MSKEEFDFDEEVKRLSRKTNINMRKSEYSFENQIRKLDKEIDKVMDKKLKEFDENKQSTQEYLHIEHDFSEIEKYRKKLRKM